MEDIQDFNSEKELEKIATKRVKKIKNFYIHVFIYSIVLVIYTLKTYYGFPFNFFPLEHINFLVMAIWTFIFVIDAIDFFFIEIVFGKKWESKIVKKMMDDDEVKNKWE